MKWINKSLFRRLLVSYLAIILIGLGLVGFSISWFMKDYMYEGTQEELLRKSKKVNLAIQNSAGIDEKTIELLAFLDQSYDTRIWIFDRDGKIMATSMKDEVFIGKSVSAPIVDKVLQGKDVLTELQFEGLKEPMLSVVIPWGKKENIYGGIVLHAPVVRMNETFNYIRETIVWATLFGVILSTVMVSYISWSISRPLRRIERTAAEIGQGNYTQRVKVEHPSEIVDLAETLNSLAEKLETVESSQKREQKVLNDFLVNISHELRTPLTAVQGFLEALQDGLVEEEDMKQKYFEIMYQETMHLNRLVEDLMDLIKLECRNISLFKTPVDIEKLLEKVASTFIQEAEMKQTTLEVKADQGLPRIIADKDRVIQILKNLVKNAVKFTDHGSVRLMAAKEQDYLKIQVADTGMGIAKDDLERVWERFFKGDRVRSKTNKGTGLGLSIVKELVELHGGKISLSSELGKGTIFTIWLPIMEEDKEPIFSHSILGPKKFINS